MPNQPPKPDRKPRLDQARHIASWDPRDFQELLTLALDVIAQAQGKLIDVKYSATSALSSVSGTKVHYSAVIIYREPDTGTTVGTVPMP